MRTPQEIAEYLAPRFGERACKEALRQATSARASYGADVSNAYIEAAIRLCRRRV